MSSLVLSDLDVNRNVRKALVRHYIDLGNLTLSAIRGHVFLRGALTRLPGAAEALSLPLLQRIFVDLERTPGVRRISFELSNWEKDSGGGWHPKETPRMATSRALRDDSDESTENGFDVTRKS